MNFKNVIFILLAVTLAFSSCSQSSQKVTLKNDVDSLSYYLGLSIGGNLKNFQQVEELNSKLMARAIDDVFSGKDTGVDEMTIDMVINQYLTKIREKSMEKNIETSKKFHEDNKSKEGVITLPSGLQYSVITEGSGPKPAGDNVVKVHYHGTLIDGTVFDSSIERGEPATFPINRVIPGWTEALELMAVGSKWELFVPPHLGYADRPPRGSVILPNSTLIFEVELISIENLE